MCVVWCELIIPVQFPGARIQREDAVGIEIVAEAVIAMKGELEKMREQIENLE